jgi:hypothetical protein
MTLDYILPLRADASCDTRELCELRSGVRYADRCIERAAHSARELESKICRQRRSHVLGGDGGSLMP